MKKRKVLVSVLLTISGISASANEYKFIQAGLTKIDTISDKPWHIAGSYPINEEYAATAHYQKVSADEKNIDSSTTLWSAGVVYHTPMNEIASETDGLISARYVSISSKAKNTLNGRSNSVDDSGFVIAGALKRDITQDIEGYGGLKYSDIAKDSDTDFIAGVRYKLSNSKLSVGVDTEAFDDWTFYARMGIE